MAAMEFVNAENEGNSGFLSKFLYLFHLLIVFQQFYGEEHGEGLSGLCLEDCNGSDVRPSHSLRQHRYASQPVTRLAISKVEKLLRFWFHSVHTPHNRQ